MKLQKSITVPEWTDELRATIIQFWEAREVRFTNTAADILEGERGSAFAFPSPGTTAHLRIDLVIAPVGPQEIIAVIEAKTFLKDISVWNKAYWLLELDSLESWLTLRDKREAEWYQFLRDSKRVATHAAINFVPQPLTYGWLRVAHLYDVEAAIHPKSLFLGCPVSVSQPILEVLRLGLLAIRAAGWKDNPGYCAVEADHLHNLPELLLSFTPRKLAEYLQTDKENYLRRVRDVIPATGLPAYQQPWEQLSIASRQL